MINAVLTRGGLGTFDAAAWVHAELLVLTGPDGDASGLAGVEVLTHSDPSPVWALDVLGSRGCQSVLVEGGGDLIFQLLDAGRIDELFVTICPRIIGGVGAPSLADGRGFGAQTIRDLSLVECSQVGDELYAHYRVIS
jgi:riboflavin biosynthesis pyrimidine reductase